MKESIFTLIFIGLSFFAFAQFEYMQFTTIESVIPAGLGRSRMITTDENGEVEEKKMKNFFSAVGINFKNIKENDEMITDQITKYSKEGWSLYLVTTGVYGADKSNGIFITRYLFKREAK
ncbi:MAG: hypothetical protein IH946_07755 [Bacteroidetes bacterium]|nr:hypothetical protein [Bacteroidota bacterium]